MEESSKMNPNPTNDSDHSEPTQPDMQLATTQGSLSTEITETEICSESSSLQSETKHQQSQNKSDSCSRQERMKTSSEEDITTYSTVRKEGSETAVPALTLLPREMWLKIMLHCVRTVGPVPLLMRAARVCRAWRDLAQEPLLWEKIFLIDQNQELLEWLVCNRLSHCKAIGVGFAWGEKTDEAVELISRHCPQLLSIYVTGILSLRGVAALFENCPKLTKLYLLHLVPGALSTFVRHLKQAVQRSSLQCLCLGGEVMGNITSNFEEIVSNCPQLKELRLMGHLGDDLVLDPERLQISCPLLRVLEFSFLRISVTDFSQEAQTQTNGLKYLKLLACRHCLIYDQETMDSLLYRLLHNSTQLKVLNLSGHQDFDGSVLPLLPVKALRELTLCMTRVTGSALQGIFQKWRHSLEKVDLSYNRPMDQSELDTAFIILTDLLPTCPLRELGLFPFIRPSLLCIRMITGQLKYLESLDISCIRDPGERHMQYRGREDMEQLHQLVCQLENARI